MSVRLAVRAAAVYRRGPVCAAFLGAVPGVEAGGPDAAFGLLGDEMAAARGSTPAWLRQRHSADAVTASRPGPSGDGDALIVARTGIAATVFAADCVPVLIASAGSVAAVHAGWRGLAGGVLASAVRELGGGQVGGFRAEAWIGPAIGPCCYEVGEDVAERVASRSGEEIVIRASGGRPRLDLQLAAARQLADLGVARVVRVENCVRCDPDWCSYRRDGAAAGRNYGFIWRTPE